MGKSIDIWEIFSCASYSWDIYFMGWGTHENMGGFRIKFKEGKPYKEC